MRLIIVFPMLLLVLLSGCRGGGPQVAPVSGTVSLDGKPLADADVTFQPDGGGRPAVARTDANGHYELMFKRGQPGAIVGTHTVRIYVSPEVVRNPPKIPARYDTHSELQREVQSGEDNVFDFDLKSEQESLKSSPKTE